MRFRSAGGRTANADLVSTLRPGHAVRQMFERSITVDEVQTVITQGEMITAYPDDQPYPSRLCLGVVRGGPIHVLLAYDTDTRTGYVVTEYIPDLSRWSDDFRTRRES